MDATIQYIEQELNGLYLKTEIKAFVRLILEYVCHLNYTDQVLTRSNTVITDCRRKKISEVVARIKNYEPVQYIFGKTRFLELNLKLTPSVMIPRPETEELVQWIIESEHPRVSSILDIGTGSGCVALSLKKHFPHTNVSAIDISGKALEIAKENCALNALDVNFFQTDILKWEYRQWDIYDVIVSNPPYVMNSEKIAMSPNVLNYEPANALFVSDNDPLIFYRRIAEFSQKYLREEGLLYFEINEKSGLEISDLMHQTGLHSVELKKDIFGKDRMLRCRR